MRASEKGGIAALILVATFAAFFFYGDWKEAKRMEQAENEEAARLETLREKLDSLELGAKAVSVYDGTIYTKIYGRNDLDPLPIASIAKTMTVLVALKEEGSDSLKNISGRAISENGDYGLFADERWKTADLARFTLLVSSNDGAYALSEGADGFLEKMNEKAMKIGMKAATFESVTGLDTEEKTASAYASAEDINLMSLYAYRLYPEIFRATVLPEMTISSESGFVHNFKNTNESIGRIPNLVFSKTGYTALAGGNLAIIFRDKRDHEIAVTVLGSTYEGRFKDMEKIVEVLYNSWI